jgi:hypothetical protein
MVIVVGFGAPFLVGVILAVLSKGRARFYVLPLLGLLLAFAFVVYGYLRAPTHYQSTCGSECEEFLGRWWEPQTVIFVVVLGYVSYLVGVGVGLLTRALIKSLSRPRPVSN